MTNTEIIDALSLWSLIASIVSIAIAVIAIWLAWLFYSKGKDSEARVETSLAEIRAQADTLKDLTASQIKQLTNAVTKQSPMEKALLAALVDSKKTESSIESIDADLSNNKDLGELTAEIVSSYIGLLYYSAMGNCLANISTQAIADEGELKGLHALIDLSYRDCHHMIKILDGMDQNHIQNSPLIHLYNEAKDRWLPLIKNEASE